MAQHTSVLCVFRHSFNAIVEQVCLTTLLRSGSFDLAEAGKEECWSPDSLFCELSKLQTGGRIQTNAHEIIAVIRSVISMFCDKAGRQMLFSLLPY